MSTKSKVKFLLFDSNFSTFSRITEWIFLRLTRTPKVGNFKFFDKQPNNHLNAFSAALGRKMRIWERRLLRDFHVVSVAGAGDEDGENDDASLGDQPKDSGADRFRKLASVAVAMNAAGMTQPVIQASTALSGRTIKPL